VILAHLRLRRRVALLAAGVLEGRELEEVRSHVEACARCRADYEEMRTVVSAMQADPLRRAEADVPVSVLLARVERDLDSGSASAPGGGGRPRWLQIALPVAAALGLAVLIPVLAGRQRPPREPARAAIPPSEASPLLTQDALDRIERNLAREQAARYLSEAGEVLVAVAATRADCDEPDGRLDVGAAPERSRELLERRRLLIESGAEAVAPARGVLNDVEMTLREVADLPSCVKRHDVERVRREVERRQLLMRIRLMTRELEG
jgi:hypothetical protein